MFGVSSQSLEIFKVYGGLKPIQACRIKKIYGGGLTAYVMKVYVRIISGNFKVIESWFFNWNYHANYHGKVI